MRLGELLNLKWEDIDFVNECICVRDSKNFESRAICMHPKIIEVLSRYKEGSAGENVFKYKSKDALGSSFRNILKRLGIKDLCFHFLRHTFASNLAMKGVDLSSIQELLGHKSPAMTKRYSHPTPEHKKKAIDMLDCQEVDTSLDTSFKNAESPNSKIVSYLTVTKE